MTMGSSSCHGARQYLLSRRSVVQTSFAKRGHLAICLHIACRTRPKQSFVIVVVVHLALWSSVLGTCWIDTSRPEDQRELANARQEEATGRGIWIRK